MEDESLQDWNEDCECDPAGSVIYSNCCDVVGAAEGVEEEALHVGAGCQEEHAEVGVDSGQLPPPPPISFL